MIRRPLPRALPILLLSGALGLGCASTRSSVRPPELGARAEPPSAEASAPAATEEPARPDDGAAATEPAPAEEAPEIAAERAELRQRILESARALLGRRGRLDCSGYVLAAYRSAGLTVALPPARNRSQGLREAAREVAVPEPGDLAFFHDTYDRNRNGRVDDGITHVALVESIDGSTVVLLHRGRRRIERLRMDLEQPSDRSLNDPVRVRRPRDSRQTRYLAGELFTSFGVLLDGAATQSLQARRAEDTGEHHPARRWRSTTARVARPEPAAPRSTRRRARSSS